MIVDTPTIIKKAIKPIPPKVQKFSMISSRSKRTSRSSGAVDPEGQIKGMLVGNGLAATWGGPQPQANQQPDRECQFGNQGYEVCDGYDHRLIAGQ